MSLASVHPVFSHYRPPVLTLSMQRAVMVFVWLTFFLNGFVLREPAPCDLLMIGFIGVLPLFGLVRFTVLHVIFFGAWMIVVATGILASATNEYFSISVLHMVITFYLALFAVVLAGFVTANPHRHLEIIWNGYICGAIIAALAGVIGYFDLIPGAFEMFTKYSRASGTFKDPNVFGPYLVPGFLYCLHNLLSKGMKHSLLSMALMGLFMFGIFTSFSRGAWMLFSVASAVYVAFFFFTTSNNLQRVKTILMCGFSLVALVGILLVASQFDKVQKLLDERLSLEQSYDVGDGGRFTGHKKATKVILEHPLGIGAQYFGYFYHIELPHNLYLTMFLTSGWIGGTVFLILIFTTLFFGFKILLRRSSWMHYHAMAISTYLGLVLESYIIDSDHWRLLYILMALIWGAFASTLLPEQAASRSRSKRDPVEEYQQAA